MGCFTECEAAFFLRIDMNEYLLLDLAADLGYELAVSGAETYRVEDSVRRVLLSYGLVFLVGQYGLKDLIARPRPCHLDQTVELLVKRPSSYSCPSTHTAWAFAAAASVWMYFKKPGAVLLAVAALIGFSRMYLFMHFPTDVLFGAVLGAALAVLTVWALNSLCDWLAARRAAQNGGGNPQA